MTVGLVEGADLVWVEGFGVSDLEKRTPMGPKSIFRVGSISKLFTALAVMQLQRSRAVASCQTGGRDLHVTEAQRARTLVHPRAASRGRPARPPTAAGTPRSMRRSAPGPRG